MSEANRRRVGLTRVGPHTFEATNARGGRLVIGEGDTVEFSPVELLLAATAACSGIDVDYVTGRRAEPELFELTATALKLRDEQGNHLGEVEVEFRVKFPDGEAGDRARAILERAVRQSRDRLCTVSRTVQLATPVTYRIEA